jgi:antitoxin component YwqK of YwqJK toxin-antitoxin module
MALTEVKTKTEHYFKDEDGKYQGEHKFWWNSDGQLMQHCFYKDGEFHGKCKQWDRNGQLRRHCFYKDGKFHGEYKWWNSDGQLYEHCFYKDDTKVINFKDNPELYPVANEDKTVFVIKYGSGQWL